MRLSTLLTRAFRRAPDDARAKNRMLQRRDWTPTHQHRKGGYYRVLGHGILEADRNKAVIYDDQEGTIWIRAAAEFEDGRFRALDGDPNRDP